MSARLLFVHDGLARREGTRRVINDRLSLNNNASRLHERMTFDDRYIYIYIYICIVEYIYTSLYI